MRLQELVVILLLLLVIFPPLTFASAGIRGQSGFHWKYIPGKEYSTSFDIYGADNLTSFLSGDLANYTELIDPLPGGGSRTIKVKTTMPNGLSPGSHVLYVGAQEAAPSGAMMGGVAAVRRVIRVMVLYPEPLLKISSFSVKNVAFNASSTVATINVRSLTKKNLSNVFAEVSFFSANNDIVGSDIKELGMKRSNPITLASGASEKIDVDLPTKTLTPGPYVAKVNVYYSQNKTNSSTRFRVGTLDLFLESYPHNLSRGIVKFPFTVRSNWNQKLIGVSGTVMLGTLKEKTPDVSIDPFGTESLKTYLDTGGFPLGPVNGTILLEGAGINKEFPITVIITNKSLEPVLVPKNEDESVDKGSHSSLLFSSYIILIVLVLLLVLINIFLLFHQRRNKRQEENRGFGVVEKSREENGSNDGGKGGSIAVSRDGGQDGGKDYGRDDGRKSGGNGSEQSVGESVVTRTDSVNKRANTVNNTNSGVDKDVRVVAPSGKFSSSSNSQKR